MQSGSHVQSKIYVLFRVYCGRQNFSPTEQISGDLAQWLRNPACHKVADEGFEKPFFLTKCKPIPSPA